MSQQSILKQKVETSGYSESYITVSDMCANAFVEDLESQYASIVTATVTNINGDYDLNIYHTACRQIQTALQQSSDGDVWYHKLTDPIDILSYSEITDESTISFLTELLNNATVSIAVSSDIDVTTPENTTYANENLNKFEINDIYFSVTLEKGTTKITQNYVLSGEVLYGKYETAVVRCSIDNSNAVLSHINIAKSGVI
jgi:hypothetical protein